MTTEVAKRATETKGALWNPTDKSDNEILDFLIRARVKLLISAPFFGTIATRLRFIDATKWCPTAATDGRNFYYNRDFVAALQAKDEGQVEFLVGHESLHCVYDHMDKTRLGNRDPRLWNVANDYVINGDLVECSIGVLIDLVQICHDYKYRGKISEEIYDDLFEQAKEEGRVINLDTLDIHLGNDDDSAGEAEGESKSGPAPGEPGNDGSNAPIKYTDEEKEQIKNEMQSAVLQSAKVAGGAGNIPSGVKRIVDSYLNPQLDWKGLLAMQIQSVIKSDYTMLNPSRKGMDAGIYLPGMDYENTIDIALALDMSGSIQDEMAREMLSEVKGIMEQYNGFRIHLFCFDTEVHNPQVFTEHNMTEFMEYELAGGGGTEFNVCWDYLKEEGIIPQKFVMFTDGYPWDSWGDESYCDTLFIVHGTGYGGKTPVAPFGITVPYKQES
jgi:predicted metal-dependent peptidase